MRTEAYSQRPRPHDTHTQPAASRINKDAGPEAPPLHTILFHTYFSFSLLFALLCTVRRTHVIRAVGKLDRKQQHEMQRHQQPMCERERVRVITGMFVQKSLCGETQAGKYALWNLHTMTMVRHFPYVTIVCVTLVNSFALGIARVISVEFKS
jgi:hypothetical protein